MLGKICAKIQQSYGKLRVPEHQHLKNTKNDKVKVIERQTLASSDES